VRWENKNTCRWSIVLIISMPKIFVNGYVKLIFKNVGTCFSGTQCRMVWLPDGEKILSIWFLILTKYTNVTTDVQTLRVLCEGMMRSIIWFLLEIYFSFQQWRNFENSLRNDKVIAMSLVYYLFLGHSVVTMTMDQCHATVVAARKRRGIHNLLLNLYCCWIRLGLLPRDAYA